MLVETVLKRKRQRWPLVGSVLLIVIGPIITELGSTVAGSFLGIQMQLLAVLGGALKPVSMLETGPHARPGQHPTRTDCPTLSEPHTGRSRGGFARHWEGLQEGKRAWTYAGPVVPT